MGVSLLILCLTQIILFVGNRDAFEDRIGEIYVDALVGVAEVFFTC
jgi:hypothetical protein